MLPDANANDARDKWYYLRPGLYMNELEPNVLLCKPWKEYADWYETNRYFNY
jgi:hypothetical protein